ncbi:F-box and WD repeat domain-containing 11-B-like [Clytia hemisphaerica]|uniref:F-box and WD repeat domain-containing 11-B-like n=1 Tax=Clytia hemisphaerica TaxID=252671 RepID=UPI0034D5962D
MNSRVWDRHTLACNKVLDGHTKGVLCLQYDGDILITGSIDGTVKVWGLTSGELMNTLEHHTKPVAILVYKHGVLVTSAALENVIYVFTVHSSKDIKLRSKLLGYRTDCLALDLDERYIVTAARDFPQRCGDTDIKVWNTKTCEHVRDITGSEEGTITLQYRYPLIVTCCFSFDMKVWDVENGTCLRTFKGHPKLLGFLRFNNKYMVSADGDGVCKIWDMEAILDQQRKEEDLLLASFQEYHSDGSILANTFANTNHLQFDDFIIMTGNSDGTIMIYDFDEEKISQHQGRKNSK